MTGDVRFRAHVANSRDTQPPVIDLATYGIDMLRPGSPKSTGIATVKPASTTRCANSATCGVMPGISLLTTTPGPLPARYTVRVVPSCVNVSAVKLSSAGVTAGRLEPGQFLAQQ